MGTLAKLLGQLPLRVAKHLPSVLELPVQPRLHLPKTSVRPGRRVASPVSPSAISPICPICPSGAPRTAVGVHISVGMAGDETAADGGDAGGGGGGEAGGEGGVELGRRSGRGGVGVVVKRAA